MSFSSGASAYGRLLRDPSARRAVVASSVCRLSYGTLGLALLLVVERATGSFAAAGGASGVLSACTLSGPAKARFIGDRHDRRRVAGLTLPYTVSLTGLATLATFHTREAFPYLVLSGAAGLAAPPVGAMMRARWASITTPSARQRAFALDTALEDGLFLAGPLLAGVLVALDGPPLAMWVTAALFAGGGTLLLFVPPPGVAPPVAAAPAGVPAAAPAGAPTAAPAAAPAGAPTGTPHLPSGVSRPLRSVGIRTVLVVLLGVSAATGVIDVAVTARAVHDANAAAAGYLLAAAALGGVVGGLIWGHTTHRLGRSWHLVMLAALVASTLAAGAPAHDLVLLGAILVVNGAALSPLLVLVYLVVDDLAGGADRTLASTWANTTFNAGIALGASAAGVLVAAAGPTAAFLVGAGTASLGLAVAVVAVAAGRTLGARQ